jgi:hypothetical protein
VPTKRIVNASPHILQTRIGRIDWFEAEDVDVIVPMPVLQEVSSLGPVDPAVRAIHDAGWGVVIPSSPVPESLNRRKLDPGEESVLTAALQTPGCEVVIDDRAGRRCAEAHGTASWHKELAPSGETQVVFRGSAFADDLAKTNMTAILHQHGLANVRSL